MWKLYLTFLIISCDPYILTSSFFIMFIKQINVTGLLLYIFLLHLYVFYAIIFFIYLWNKLNKKWWGVFVDSLELELHQNVNCIA